MALYSGPVLLAATAAVVLIAILLLSKTDVDQRTSAQGQAVALALLGASFLVVTGWAVVVREKSLLALSLVGAPATMAVLVTGTDSQAEYPILLIAAVPAVLGLATLTRIDRSRLQRATFVITWISMLGSIYLTSISESTKAPVFTGVTLIVMLAILALTMETQKQMRGTDIALVAATGAFVFPLIAVSFTNNEVGPSLSLNFGGTLLAVSLVLAAFERAREQSSVQLRRVESFGVKARSEVVHRELREKAERERAHEARSSLLALQAAVSTLQGCRDSLSEEKLNSLVTALGTELGRLRELVDPLETHSRAEHFDLRELLEPSVTLQREAGLDVHFRIPDGLLISGRADDVVEVFLNLLDNASKYAAGSPVVVTHRSFDDELHLMVEDRGPGLASNLEEIFKDGFQVGSERVGGGVGLGLSRRLMREQGGDLYAEYRPSAGACFVVKLRVPSGAS